MDGPGPRRGRQPRRLLLIAALSELGPRLGVPSVIAARAALGSRGAGLVAVLLYATNFAWIAVNNVIAASACAQVAGGPASQRAWAVGLGIVSTLIVAGGPRLVALADRLAVPLLLLVGLVLTVACLRLPFDTLAQPGSGGMPWIRGLDIVVGYQVSWILMFADYSRYTAIGPQGGGGGVPRPAGDERLDDAPRFHGGTGGRKRRSRRDDERGAPRRLGRRADDGGHADHQLRQHLHVGAGTAAACCPVGPQASVWSTGLVGAALSLFRARGSIIANFMLVLGGILVPVGGVLLAQFLLLDAPVDAADLYPGSRRRYAPLVGLWSTAGMAAWIIGAAVFYIDAADRRHHSRAWRRRCYCTSPCRAPRGPSRQIKVT